jgi:hypothetical protein
MRWKTKGHEFDEVYNNIKQKKNLYLFGAGLEGKKVYEIITDKFKDDFHLLGFIDNNLEKQGKLYCGLKVYRPTEIDLLNNDTGIVISISSVMMGELQKQLEGYGLIKNRDFYHYAAFFSVYAAYAKNQLFFSSVSFLPSTRCNLHCEACLNFTPYMDKFEERNWEQIIHDIDSFFKCVDYIMVFHVSGGEPLLYPHIATLLTYIAKHYGDKIYSLETVTNGTVLPSEEFLKVFHDYPIKITVDDYRDALPEYRGDFTKIIETLANNGGQGRFVIQKYDEWIDLAPYTTHHEAWTMRQLEKHFNACHVPWQEFRKGKLYLCNYSAYAAVAGIIDEPQADEYYDFLQYDKSKLKELMEFRLGYSQKGYVEFCKRCAGFFEVNSNKVMPAKQSTYITK